MNARDPLQPIEKDEADGKKLPFAIFANQSHFDVHGIAGCGGFTDFHGQKGEIVGEFGAADLQLGSTRGGFTAQGGPAGSTHDG